MEDRSISGIQISANMHSKSFRNCRFVNCVFLNSNFTSSSFFEVDFQCCKIVSPKMGRSTLFSDSKFRDSELTGVRAKGTVDFDNTLFERCKISGYFSDVAFRGMSLSTKNALWEAVGSVFAKKQPLGGLRNVDLTECNLGFSLFSNNAIFESVSLPKDCILVSISQMKRRLTDEGQIEPRIEKFARQFVDLFSSNANDIQIVSSEVLEKLDADFYIEEAREIIASEK